ncbi:MAG TPA: DapH/DapD/GlmU-related protein [Holophaga sp.]|jgi:bifunctional UDP-N-acetylglucosamine pyrophosphorylase/glucosamine-1-phosphate N-acetyltransferase|nr:DapH/DapD/GlmU-related protein [Holophaga sp.]
MNATALILAHGQSECLCSNLPPCLHAILGDAALLWVLRALPENITQARVFHDGDTRISEAMERWSKEGLLPCPASTLNAEDFDTLGEAPILVLRGDAPLIAFSGLLDGLDAKDITNKASLPGFFTVQSAKALLTVPGKDLPETKGLRIIANRRDIAALQTQARTAINDRWMDRGVTIVDPASTFIGPRVELAPDVLIEPQVRLEGSVHISRSARIGQGSILQDTVIAEDVEIKPYTLSQSAQVGPSAIVGPFARLREGSVLEARVHVGNFVETKKTTLHAGAKANHLTYLGDAEVGEMTNVGAGVITCNYDGFRKHKTVIGKNVFVGSDTQLIAPVTIGDGALLAAGSTISQDVPGDALAITRATLTVKAGSAARLREKLRNQIG